MGKITEFAPNGGAKKPEPNEIRCQYRATVKILVRNVDVDFWREYIRSSVPDSYEAEFGPMLASEPITIVRLSYEAASANANDINKRLRIAQLHHLPVSSDRARMCGCPSGTTRCKKRLTK